MDLNTSAPDTGNTPPPVSTPSDSSAPRERVSVKDSIRQAFDQHRDAPERETADRSSERERPAPGQAAEPDDTEDDVKDARSSDRSEAGDTDSSASADIDEEADEAPKEVAAPSSWSKEAKETWANLPERARAEIAKREKDMERGVKALKDKYKEVDEAFAPYMDTIQRFQKTPGAAVHQLFSWFNALAENPREAFPALIDSYKQDPRQIVEHYWPGALQRYAQMEQYIKSLPQNRQPQQQQQQNQQGQQQGQPQQQQQQPIVHPQVANYIKQLEQKLTGLEQAVTQRFTSQDQYYEQQNAARTSEYLDQWAKEKPHFERVRVLMGQLLTPGPDGRAVVPLRDGRVDLDGAYQKAIRMDDEVWNEIQEQQRQERVAKAKAKREADLAAQQAEADRARKASGSLTSSAPGTEIGRKPIAPKGMTVRESLQQTIRDLSGR